MGVAMTLGAFMKFLALCGYPAQGGAVAGGGIAGLKSPGVLAQSGVPASVTGTTTPTVLASVTIPPLGPNSALRVSAIYSFTGSAGNRNVDLRLNGVSVRQFIAASSIVSCEVITIIRNRGATNSQVTFGQGQAGTGTNAGAGNTATNLDTSIPTTLTLLASPVVSTDSLYLSAYTVEILNP